MLVRDWMTSSVVAVSPQTSVLNARRLLSTHRIRHLPVAVDGCVVGIVSDRDVRISDVDLVRSLSSLQSDLVTGRYRTVETVMSTPAIVVSPDADLAAAARLLIERRIGAVPVVEEDRLVGILSLTDCVAALLTPAPQPPPLLDDAPPVPLPGSSRDGHWPRHPAPPAGEPPQPRPVPA